MLRILKTLPQHNTEEAEKLKKSEDANGIIDIAKAFDPPEASDPVDLTSAVEDVKEHRGLTESELYRKEYQLKTVHNLMLHGATTMQIADKMAITPNQAKRLQKELNQRIIAATRKLDKHELAGKTLMFYDKMIAETLKLAAVIDTSSNAGHKINSNARTKVEIYKVAIQSQTDKQRFLTAAGFWNNGIADEGNANNYSESANEMRDLLGSVISGEDFEIINTSDELDDGIDIL